MVRVLGNPASMIVTEPRGTLILNGGINATMVVAYSVRDATGETIPWAIPTFTSSDPSMVRVFGNRLHAVGTGTVTITASYAGLPDYQFQVVVQ